IPGTLPTRLTTILSLLLPVSTFTALLMVMLSRLMPFTSTSLSPTSRPAASENNHGGWRGLLSHTLSSTQRTLQEHRADGLSCIPYMVILHYTHI
uniref:Uncharacterized protein n=1 Tax=Neolamprologus brichardi TaxID=32507 RepID=A0A3Q4GTZ1_NEOBR